MAATGLDDFKFILKEFRWLSIWSVGGATVPFAAALAELSPPWPSGIVLVTAIIELITIAVSFQLFKGAKRVVVNTVLLISLISFAGAGITYLWNLSRYTYQVPTTNERFTKGNICTPDARNVFGSRCPELGLDELRQAEYEAERLWTQKSLATIRVRLVFLWSATFLFLSLLLGTFLVYQTAQKGRRRR
ncbi:hypothetical protein [Candidatus Electrothrix sp.]|uniref:hypothetical protein n=1 Tax=Candidatus Electrothrix sp. TaxID=2170559 RepID=UPI004056F291